MGMEKVGGPELTMNDPGSTSLGTKGPEWWPKEQGQTNDWYELAHTTKGKQCHVVPLKAI